MVGTTFNVFSYDAVWKENLGICLTKYNNFIRHIEYNLFEILAKLERYFLLFHHGLTLHKCHKYILKVSFLSLIMFIKEDQYG